MMNDIDVYSRLNVDFSKIVQNSPIMSNQSKKATSVENSYNPNSTYSFNYRRAKSLKSLSGDD